MISAGTTSVLVKRLALKNNQTLAACIKILSLSEHLAIMMAGFGQVIMSLSMINIDDQNAKNHKR